MSIEITKKLPDIVSAYDNQRKGETHMSFEGSEKNATVEVTAKDKKGGLFHTQGVRTNNASHYRFSVNLRESFRIICQDFEDDFDYQTTQEATKTFDSIPVTIAVAVGSLRQTQQITLVKRATNPWDKAFSSPEFLVEYHIRLTKFTAPGYPYDYSFNYPRNGQLGLPYFEGYPFSIIKKGETSHERLAIDDGGWSHPKYNYIGKNECGVYLKWFNRLGGWSYWLFKDISAKTKFKTLDYSNPYDIIERKTGKEIRQLYGEIETENAAHILGLIVAPKVYLFLGKKFQKVELSQWLTASITNSSTLVKKDTNKTKFKLHLQLPKLNTLD